MPVWKPKTSRYWHCRFAIDGRVFRGTTGKTTRRAAERAMQEWRAQIIAEGRGIVARRRPVLTLDEAAGRWWRERGAHRAKPRDAYRAMARLLAFLGAGTLLDEIADSDIAAYVAERRGMVSPATVNREIETFRALVRHARRAWKVEAPDIDFGAHLLDEPAERVRELTRDEEARLWAALRPDYHPIVRFCLWSGVRAGDAITLTWRQVDFDAGAIRLASKSRKPGGQPHVLPMTAALAELLRGLRGHHAERVFTYIGRRQDGRQPITTSGLRAVWVRACAAAGIVDFRFHDLRHTAATRMLRATGNMRAVQRALGHTDIATTTRYAHATNDDVRAALEAGHGPSIVSPSPRAAAKQL